MMYTLLSLQCPYTHIYHYILLNYTYHVAKNYTGVRSGRVELLYPITIGSCVQIILISKIGRRLLRNIEQLNTIC